MALPLLEQLARHLNVSREEAGQALFSFVERLKYDINNRQRAEIRGVGSLEATPETILFRPDAGLSLMVNNRFAALETETVQVGVKSPAEPRLGAISGDSLPDFDLSTPDTAAEGTDDTLLGDDILDDAFWAGIPDAAGEHPLGTASQPPFEEADFSVLQPASSLANDITNAPESGMMSGNGATPMKEDDPKSPLFSDEDRPESSDEWSPFFEELEGVEFEVDSPLDLDDTVWDSANPPKPPSSPFAGERDDDEFFFESERDAELFGASFDDEMTDDNAWAASPTEDSPFFEDRPNARRPGAANPLDEFGTEDELFGPSASDGDANNDALFGSDDLLRGAQVSEADETIFLPPDARESGRSARSPGAAERLAAAAAAAAAPAAADAQPARAERRPYDRRHARSGSKNNSIVWIGIVGLLLVLAGGAYAYLNGMLPFGPGASQSPVASTPPAPVTPDPAPETPATTPDPAATTPETPGSAAAPTTPAPAPPAAAAPRGFAAGRGGWTIVVSSRETVAEAEELVARYAQIFANEGFPVDILRTEDFATPRYRVGVGQFGSRQAATAAISQNSRSLPGDAWVIAIPR